MHPSTCGFAGVCRAFASAILCAPGLLSTALAAEPTGDELALLTTFRREFVDVTPGKGPFREQ